MKNDLALRDEKQRYAKLLECERIIRLASQRGIEAARQIGEYLQIIEDEQLYLDRGCQSLSEYAQDYLKMNRMAVARCLQINSTAELLEENNLRLPENESQLLELNKVSRDQIPVVWQQILDEQDRIERPLTAKVVQEEVKKAQPAKARAGVRTALDEESGSNDNGESAKAEAKKRITLSEAGEAALEKIRRHAGDSIANAIEDMTVPIHERDLCKWADEQPWMIKKLAFYIVHQRWSLSRAIKYEAEAITEQTSVAELIIMAKFSETPGTLDTSFRDARIRVDISHG